MVRLVNVLTGPVNHCYKEWEPRLLHFNNNEKQINCKTCTLHMVTFPHLEKNATFGFQIFVHMFGRKIIFFPTMLSMRQFRPHLQIFAPPPSWLPQPGKHAMAIIQCSSSTQWDNMMSVCTSPRGPTYSGQRGRILLLRWPIYLITCLIWNA